MRERAKKHIVGEKPAVDPRASRAAWLLPVVVAAGLRIAELVIGALRDPLFAKPVVDTLFHAHQAREILEKGWLLAGTGAFYKGPLYSYLLAVLAALFGDDGAIVAARVVNAAAGVGSVYFVARAAERIAGPVAGRIAGFALALYGTAIYFDTTPLLEPLVALCLLAAADRLMAVEGGAPKPRALAIAGALLGVASLVRANVLLALAAAAWCAWRLARGERSETRLEPWRAVALVIVPGLLVIAPATLRNAVFESDPVLVSFNGGINLFMGNDPAFDQRTGNWHPDLSWTRLYEMPETLGRERGADHQRFFLAQARRAAFENPGRTLGILVEKTLWLLAPYEIPNNRRLDEARARSPLLALLMFESRAFYFPFALVLPALVVGIAALSRDERRRFTPHLLLALAAAIVPVLFFNTARFRLPAVIVLLAPAALGWLGLARRHRARGIVAALGFCVAVGLLSSWLTTRALSPAPQPPPSDLSQLAQVAAREGRQDERLRFAEAALAQDPDDPIARIRLGDALRTAGRCGDAREHYDAVVNAEGLASEWRLAALRSRARCFVVLGRPGDAVADYSRVLDANPDAPMTGSRPDFHLRDVPPVASCRIRIERSEALARADRIAEAAADLAAVIDECAAAESLAADAQRRLAALAAATGRR